MRCRLCGGSTSALFSQRIVNRYDVAYFQCGSCELIQSEVPYWLDEIYGNGAMADADTGAIARNAMCAQTTSVISRLLKIPPEAICADFGGGHGVFVRMMRDRGMDFRLCDKYAQNLFARGFDTTVDQRCAMMTAFEVFEHLAEPGAEMERIFSGRHEFVLVGTVLHRGHRPGWWYYTPQTGQHVAFYSSATMRMIGDRFGYDTTGGPAYTLFKRRGVEIEPFRAGLISQLLRNTLAHRNAKLTRVLDVLLPAYPSRVPGDFAEISRKLAA